MRRSLRAPHARLMLTPQADLYPHILATQPGHPGLSWSVFHLGNQKRGTTLGQAASETPANAWGSPFQPPQRNPSP